MKASFEDITKKIQTQAEEKYNSESMIDLLKTYNPDVFQEIVEYFKEQNEQYPHLEAFEIYLLIEENLPSENPSKEDIRQTIESLLDVGMPE